MLQLEPRVAEALDITLLNLTSQLTGAQQESYARGTLQIKPKRQLGFVAFKCAPQLRRLARIAEQCIGTSYVIYPVPTVTSHFYCCPVGHQKAADFSFDLHNASKPVWCGVCAKPYVGAKWSCACNKPWHTCPIHPPRATASAPRKCGK